MATRRRKINWVTFLRDQNACEEALRDLNVTSYVTLQEVWKSIARIEYIQWWMIRIKKYRTYLMARDLVWEVTHEKNFMYDEAQFCELVREAIGDSYIPAWINPGKKG